MPGRLHPYLYLYLYSYLYYSSRALPFHGIQVQYNGQHCEIFRSRINQFSLALDDLDGELMEMVDLDQCARHFNHMCRAPLQTACILGRGVTLTSKNTDKYGLRSSIAAANTFPFRRNLVHDHLRY